MRIESTGKRKPGKLARFLQRLVGRINSLHTVVDVREDDYRYRFLCPNDQTLRRATTLLIKEKGTVEWLRQQAQPGKVFLDIGANIGIYSIYAGHRLGATGRVYAVEPHLCNASALIDNVVANGLSERINVMAVALADKPGMLDFCYRDWDTGSSHSQLSVGENRRAYEAVVRELKSACSVRQLIDDGVMQPPDFVKIDVDGSELDILHGMKSTLMREERPTHPTDSLLSRRTRNIFGHRIRPGTAGLGDGRSSYGFAVSSPPHMAWGVQPAIRAIAQR